MKTGAKWLLLVLSVFGVVGLFGAKVSAAGTVTINEFVSNPVIGESDWIELHNSGSESMPLSGWYLRDTAASNLKTFGSNDQIPARGFLVVSVGTRLGNSGDTIELYNPSGLVDKVIYPVQVPAPTSGKSAGRQADGLGSFIVFDTPTKGTSNNPAPPKYGEIRVHAVKEIWNNNFPDFPNGEPHQPNIPIRVYRVNSNGWSLENSGLTTGKYYKESLRFRVQIGQYAICLPELEGYDQTFAFTITGWWSFPDYSVDNASGQNDEYKRCISVNVLEDKVSAHVFGLLKHPETL